MSTRYSSKGTVLQLSIASVFTTVGGISNIDYPDSEVQFFDGTALESGVSMEDGEPTGHTAPGSVSGEFFYDPLDSTHQAVIDFLGSPAKASWKIKNDNISGHACTFTGTLKKCQPKAKVNDGLVASLDIKLASIATYAP